MTEFDESWNIDAYAKLRKSSYFVFSPYYLLLKVRGKIVKYLIIIVLKVYCEKSIEDTLIEANAYLSQFVGVVGMNIA